MQLIPVDSVGRDQNALYLAPRRITESEFNSPELNTFIDTMNSEMMREEGVGIAANQLGKNTSVITKIEIAESTRHNN